MSMFARGACAESHKNGDEPDWIDRNKNRNKRQEKFLDHRCPDEHRSKRDSVKFSAERTRGARAPQNNAGCDSFRLPSAQARIETIFDWFGDLYLFEIAVVGVEEKVVLARTEEARNGEYS